MTALARKRIFAGLRLVVCAAALWFVIRGVTLYDHVILRRDNADWKGTIVKRTDEVVLRLVDGTERSFSKEELAVDEEGNPRVVYGLKTAWRQSSTALLLAALAIHAPVTFLLAMRLQILLAAQAIRLTYWECAKLSFAGNFLSFATPFGSNAGDVFKAYFVTTHTERKTEAATTILLDRALGLVVVLASVAVLTTLSASGSRLSAFRGYVLLLSAIGVATAAIYFSPLMGRLFPLRTWAMRRPVFGYLERIDRTARTLLADKRSLAAALLTTIVLQVIGVGAFVVVARAIGMSLHSGNIHEYYAYFYTGAVIQALPGPPQGLGTVELAYRYLFAPYGTPSQIVSLAFLVRMVGLFWALPGLAVTATGAYRATAPRETVMGAVEKPVESGHDLAVR